MAFQIGIIETAWDSVAEVGSPYFWKSLSVYLACTVVLTTLDARLDVREDGTTAPDLLFGYTPEKLTDLYGSWGQDGRTLYATKLAPFDLFPYAPSYTVFFGGLLRWATHHKFGWSKAWTYPMLLMMLLDYAETITQAYLARTYSSPEQLLDPSLVGLGSTANRLKWSLFVLILPQILAGFVVSRFESATKDKGD